MFRDAGIRPADCAAQGRTYGAIFGSRTLRSTPESAARAGYDGAKRKKGSKRHMAVEMFGHPLALRVTPANRDDRPAIGGERPAEAARAYGSALEIVKLTEDKLGFVLLLRR